VKHIERLFMVAGTALFVWLVYRVGVGTLFSDLSLVGMGFALILGQELLAFLFNTLGWRYAMGRAERGRVRFFPLLAMRIAGDAVNYLTPSASVGGEFIKVRLLQRTVAAPEAVGSVGLAAINQFLSQIGFIVISVPFFASQAVTPSLMQIAVGVCGLVVLVGALLFFLGWRRDLFRVIREFLVRRGWFDRWTRDADAWRTLDRNIFGSFRERPGGNLLSVFFFILGWGMGAVEVYLILYFLKVPVDWRIAVGIEGLSILIDMSFFYVPAKIGTQEGGKYFIFLLLGLDPQSGFALGVVRRLREIAWALFGMLILGYYQRGGHAAHGRALGSVDRALRARRGDLPS